MSEPINRYNISLNIQITGTDTKKNNVRDALLDILQTAKDNDNIDQASWSVSQNVVPEGGVIK